MKTNTNPLGWILLSCFLLLNFTALAQYPVFDAKIGGTPAVTHGLLEDLDQRTSPIWFKVNGNIVGPQPHNKMMVHPNGTNYVTPGSTVDVNFNINRNRGNRYTMVTYSLEPVEDQPTKLRRKIYDYQSNMYNANTPVQGNSNRQRVLVPTCRYEIYFVKGALVDEFEAGAYIEGAAYNPFTDSGNPYTHASAGVPAGQENRIIEYAYGGQGTCDDCPEVINTSDCVYSRILEVLDITGSTDKELIFSVINNINTKTANGCGTGWPEIGDIIFTNITPTPNTPNQPYSFRYNYQLGPQIANYNIPGHGTANAFVFDQRNNHNILDYDVYQSEIVRFRVTEQVFNTISSPATTAKPQICVELSNKQPQPHQTLPPVHCADIDFVCGDFCPVVGDECAVENCDYRIELAQVQGVADPVTGSFTAYLPAFEVTNISGQNITSVTFTTTGTTAVNADFDDLDMTPENIFGINAAPNLLTYNNPVPAWSQAGGMTAFFYEVDAASVATVSGSGITLHAGSTVTVTITNAANQTFSYDFAIAVDDPNAPVADCQIIPLPVELTSFTGKAVTEGIALNWKTASEKNNDRFEVERSVDGRNFEKIGTVKGNGTSNTAHSYTFLDKTAKAGTHYYRLNQVDFSGANARSKVIRVSAEKASTLGVQLIPNPCQDQNCTVKLQGVDTSTPLTVELRDLTGRLIFSQQVAADQTSFKLPNVNTGNGVYILRATNGTYTAHQKIIIQ